MGEQDIDQLFENIKPIFWKKSRLETFKHWPFKSNEHQCNPENMARAGFYVIGGEDEPDLVECFMCHKQLDGWELDDDPWQEHKKHQPDCEFIKIDKPNELDLTLMELFDLMFKFYKHEMRMEFEKSLENAKKKWKEIGGKLEVMKSSKTD